MDNFVWVEKLCLKVKKQNLISTTRNLSICIISWSGTYCVWQTISLLSFYITKSQKFLSNISNIPVARRSANSITAHCFASGTNEAYSFRVDSLYPSSRVRLLAVGVMVVDTAFYEIYVSELPRPPEKREKIHVKYFRQQFGKINHFNAPIKNYNTLTAHTGSRVSPTKKVTSHSSGMDAKNFKSSANPVLFSNIVKSGSSASGPSLVKTSGILPSNFFSDTLRWKKMLREHNGFKLNADNLGKCQHCTPPRSFSRGNLIFRAHYYFWYYSADCSYFPELMHNEISLHVFPWIFRVRFMNG